MNFNNFNKYNDINETGAEFIPYNPLTYDLLDCKIVVRSVNSRHFKTVQREVVKAGVKGSNDDYIVQIIAGLVIGWENIEDGKGQMEFNPENLSNLLSSQSWLLNQLEKFVENSSNFFLLK